MIKINTEALISMRNKAQENKIKYSGTQDNLHHHNHVPNNENAKETTYLYIRSFNEDKGIRNPPLGHIERFASPDIKIYQNGTSINTTQLISGQDYQIGVTVRNDGDMNCPNFYLELFVTHPHVANDINPILIGVQRGVVNRHSSKEIQFNFSTVVEHSGPRALIARVFSPSCNEFPLTANGFDEFHDRHVAKIGIRGL